MELQIKPPSFLFRFWGAVFFSLACVSITLSLSIWQFNRATWKNQILQSIERNKHLPSLTLESHCLSPLFIQENPHRCFISQGNFDLNSLIYVGPKTYNGKPGYHLYALFYPQEASSAPIWILCGWLENRHSPSQILNNNEQTLTISLELPIAKGLFTPDNIPAKNQWYWPDIKAMSAHQGGRNECFGKLLSSFTPLSPHLVTIGIANLPPNRHLEYALTWLALSIILTFLGTYFCTKQWKAIYAQPTRPL